MRDIPRMLSRRSDKPIAGRRLPPVRAKWARGKSDRQRPHYIRWLPWPHGVGPNWCWQEYRGRVLQRRPAYCCSIGQLPRDSPRPSSGLPADGRRAGISFGRRISRRAWHRFPQTTFLRRLILRTPCAKPSAPTDDCCRASVLQSPPPIVSMPGRQPVPVPSVASPHRHPVSRFGSGP